MTDHYEDILHLPHHVSTKRTPMSRESRAAQFAPFAALTGYEDAVEETARQTDAKQELTEEQAEKVNQVLYELSNDKERHCELRITYFVPDQKKAGGRYMTLTGRVYDVEVAAERLVMYDRTRIPFADILNIERAEIIQ